MSEDVVVVVHCYFSSNNHFIVWLTAPQGLAFGVEVLERCGIFDLIHSSRLPATCSWQDWKVDLFINLFRCKRLLQIFHVFKFWF